MTFGMVAGLGIGAGIFYYRALVNAHLAKGLVPHIVMVHADAQKVMSLANAREASQLAGYLTTLLRQLAGGGAHIATIPAFAPQLCAEELAAQSPFPLISLLDATVDEVQHRRLTRVAVFGARVTMETALFGQLRSVADVIPLRFQRARPSQPYLRKCRQGGESTSRPTGNSPKPGTRADRTRKAGRNLDRRHRLSFVLDPETAGFPHVDGARAHIDAIMRVLTSEDVVDGNEFCGAE